MWIRRRSALALLLVLASCGAQVAAPRGDSPTAQRSAAGELAPDVLYVRQSGNGQTALISVIDARSGAVLRALPNGVVSADRSTLYRTELLNGGGQTRVSATDLATGRETRTFAIDGAFRMLTNIDGPAGLTPDGRWLVLTRDTIKLGDQWVTGFAVVNAATGAVSGRVEFKSASTYTYAGVAPNAASVFLQEQGDAAIRLRVWDFTTSAFLPDSAIGAQWDGRQAGFATAPIATPDGKALAWLDTGKSSAPVVRVLDLMTRRVATIALPDGQRSDDFEKYLLWSLALSRDGTTLYAVNPALGFIDELFLRAGLLNRTNRINVTRASDGALAALARSLFPVAEAKRYIRGGAVLSLDGRTLYAAGTKGIAVIDVATLGSRMTWATDSSFDSFALSPDGARLYGISDQLGKIRVVRTSDGAVLGELKPASYPGEIVRVDLAADPNVASSAAAVQACGAYAPPDPSVGAEVAHLKTSATVIEILGPCTLRVRIAGGSGPLVPFTERVITLRATSQTSFASADQGDLTAIGRFGLKPQDSFTLSFDGRAFPDGSYPLNFMNR
jgi:DNA-binding beta-propeller fold protein YncE